MSFDAHKGRRLLRQRGRRISGLLLNGRGVTDEEVQELAADVVESVTDWMAGVWLELERIRKLLEEEDE